jgi:hypothetical protein
LQGAGAYWQGFSGEYAVSTLTDQLNEHFDKMDADGGMSTLHLLSLPKSINRVLRLFLKHKQISYTEILTSVEAMPEGERLTPVEVQEMLDVLIKREWLEKMEVDSVVNYGINLRPAIASATTKATSTQSEGADKADEAWKKAGLESMGAPKETASQMHATMMTAAKKEDASDKPSPETAAKEEPPKTEEKPAEKTKKETGSLSADDLWKALD